MTRFKVINPAISFAAYSAILIVAYGPLPVGVAVALLCVVYLFLILQSIDMAILFPFYLYPFMFLVRARDPENLLVTTLPEIFALIAIVLHYIRIDLKVKIDTCFLLLFFYSVIIASIVMLHVKDIYYLPLTLRQYVLPGVFMVVFLDASARRNGLPLDALKISFNSFALVAALSILNILGIFTIDASMEALYPFLNYAFEGDAQQIVRSFNDSEFFPRLNLFTGGALGSSAAIFIALGLIPYLSKKIEMSWLHKLASVFLLAAGAMTLSTSIVIPVAIFLFLVLGTKINRYLAGFGFVLCLLIVSNMTLFVSDTLFDYVFNSSISGFVSYLVSIDLWAILFGSGPRFTSAGFKFVPDNFVIDVGVLRVFVETGAVSFIIFFLFLVSIFRKGWIVGGKSDMHGGRVFFFLFLIFVLTVHGNMTALPPFFPLFSVVVAGIVRAYCFKVDKSFIQISRY